MSHRPGYPDQMVYRLHAEDGRILYIGRSCDVAKRLRGHYSQLTHPYVDEDKRPTWLLETRRVSMVGPFSWEEACQVERSEIEAHQPEGNRQFTRRHGWVPGLGRSCMSTTAIDASP